MKPPQVQLNLVSQAVEKITGTNPLAPTRQFDVIWAKQLLVLILVGYYYRNNDNVDTGCPGCYYIGKMIERNHSTVISLYREGNNRYELDKKFKSDYHKSLDLFEKLVKECKQRTVQPCDARMIRVVNTMEKKLLIGRR